jgi:hypothetical protein
MARFQYQEAGSLGAGYCRGIQLTAVHTAMMSNIIAKARTPPLGLPVLRYTNEAKHPRVDQRPHDDAGCHDSDGEGG